jgi:hypothetical protein
MKIAIIASRKKPYPQTEKKEFEYGHLDRLMPKAARVIAAAHFPNDNDVEVWDLDAKFGYRIYGKSARKLKW